MVSDNFPAIRTESNAEKLQPLPVLTVAFICIIVGALYTVWTTAADPIAGFLGLSKDAVGKMLGVAMAAITVLLVFIAGWYAYLCSRFNSRVESLNRRAAEIQEYATQLETKNAETAENHRQNEAACQEKTAKLAQKEEDLTQREKDVKAIEDAQVRCQQRIRVLKVQQRDEMLSLVDMAFTGFGRPGRYNEATIASGYAVKFILLKVIDDECKMLEDKIDKVCQLVSKAKSSSDPKAPLQGVIASMSLLVDQLSSQERRFRDLPYYVAVQKLIRLDDTAPEASIEFLGDIRRRLDDVSQECVRANKTRRSANNDANRIQDQAQDSLKKLSDELRLNLQNLQDNRKKLTKSAETCLDFALSMLNNETESNVRS